MKCIENYLANPFSISSIAWNNITVKRFEVRLGIDKMAEIVRGLIGTVRGDDTVTYFEMLSRDLNQLELQRLNDIASMQPGKVGKYQLIVLAVMIANYVVIMVLYVMGLDRPF